MLVFENYEISMIQLRNIMSQASNFPLIVGIPILQFDHSYFIDNLLIFIRFILQKSIKPKSNKLSLRF